MERKVTFDMMLLRTDSIVICTCNELTHASEHPKLSTRNSELLGHEYSVFTEMPRRVDYCIENYQLQTHLVRPYFAVTTYRNVTYSEFSVTSNAN